MNNIYKLIKSAILDVSTYVDIGLSVDDIEECIEDIIIKNKMAVVRPVQTMLMYEIKTLYQNDDDVVILLNNIIDALDIMVIDVKKEKYFEN